MLRKIQIKGIIELKTGMHIGDSGNFSAIGAIDSLTVKDPLTMLPYIPGSSLKGKMRSLLAKAYNEGPVKKRDDDDKRITRLFGCSKDEKGNPHTSRLIFSDAILCNSEGLRKDAGQETEAKYENNIDPLTAVADPRQIERVIRGAKFPLDIIYNVEEESEIKEDMKTLSDGIKLLGYDYIGGNGTRGYGRVKFEDIKLETVVGQEDNALMEELNALFEG